MLANLKLKKSTTVLLIAPNAIQRFAVALKYDRNRKDLPSK